MSPLNEMAAPGPLPTIPFDQLNTQQMALLDANQIGFYKRVELMRLGIEQPKPPVVDPVPEMPELRKVDVYRIYVNDHSTDIAFLIEAPARDLCEATPSDLPGFVKHEWSVGQGVDTIEPPHTVTYKRESMIVKVDLEAHREAIDARRRIVDGNSQRERDFAAASKKASEATAGIDRAIAEAREEYRLHERARSTFAEYVGLCNGDRQQARVFLRKLFSSELLLDELDKVIGWVDPPPSAMPMEDRPEPRPEPAPLRAVPSDPASDPADDDGPAF